MFQCDKCNKEFKFKSQLNIHLNRKTACNKKNEYICKTCNKIFLKKSNFENHLNKKNKCFPDLSNIQEQIIELKNTVNNTNINSNNSINNSYNKNFHLHLHVNELKNNKEFLNELLSLKDLDKIIHNAFIFNDYLKLLRVDNEHNENNVLDNTEEIKYLFKKLFCNNKIIENIIFCLNINLDENIYIKKDTIDIDKLDTSTLVYIIYECFNILIKEYKNSINKKLIQFYKKFIKAYQENLFHDLNHIKVKSFLDKIINDLRFNIISLYEDLKLLNKKDYFKLEQKNIKFRTELEIKKSMYIENNISDKHVKFNIIEINNILIRYYSFNNNKIKIFHDYFEENYYYILALLEYYLNKKYFNFGELASVICKKGKFFKKCNLIEENLDKDIFIENLKDNIFNLLKNNNIDYKDNNFIINKNSYNFDNLYEKIDNDIYDGMFGINGLTLIVEYLFSFNKIEYIKQITDIVISK